MICVCSGSESVTVTVRVKFPARRHLRPGSHSLKIDWRQITAGFEFDLVCVNLKFTVVSARSAVALTEAGPGKTWETFKFRLGKPQAGT